MKFIWQQNENGLYYIMFTNPKSKIGIGDLLSIASYVLKIDKKVMELFIKDNGGKKQLDDEYYFKNKFDVINVTNQLNAMKKLGR